VNEIYAPSVAFCNLNSSAISKQNPGHGELKEYVPRHVQHPG
jgi:hypothetical protein